MITGTKLLASVFRASCLLIAILLSAANATTIYVDSRATAGSNDGWNRGHSTL